MMLQSVKLLTRVQWGLLLALGCSAATSTMREADTGCPAGGAWCSADYWQHILARPLQSLLLQLPCENGIALRCAMLCVQMCSQVVEAMQNS